MGREREILKLVNVLRQTARMAVQAELTGGEKDAAPFCVEKYNRVLARLKVIDEDVSTVFEPLTADSSLTVAAIACRQLAAYYEDELGRGVRRERRRHERAYGIALDPFCFKDFWRESSGEIEDLGEFIRESIAEWTRRRKGEHEPPEGPEL